MKTFSQSEIMNRYERLPQAVKDSIFAEATAERMETIGRKHGLLLDAIGNLATETGYVMVGLVHPQEFPGRIASVLGISAAKAAEITEDISNEVFKPIREHMLKAFNIVKDEAPSGPPTAPKPSFVPQTKVSDVKPFISPVGGSIPTAPPPPIAPKLETPPVVQVAPQPPVEKTPAPTEKIAPMIFPDKSKVEQKSATPPAPQFNVPKPVAPPAPEPQKPIAPVFGAPTPKTTQEFNTVPSATQPPPAPPKPQIPPAPDPYREEI